MINFSKGSKTKPLWRALYFTRIIVHHHCKYQSPERKRIWYIPSFAMISVRSTFNNINAALPRTLRYIQPSGRRVAFFPSLRNNTYAAGIWALPRILLITHSFSRAHARDNMRPKFRYHVEYIAAPSISTARVIFFLDTLWVTTTTTRLTRSVGWKARARARHGDESCRHQRKGF